MCVYVCATIAQAAVFTVHLSVPNNTQGPNPERKVLSMSSLSVLTQVTDMLESLRPGVCVF